MKKSIISILMMLAALTSSAQIRLKTPNTEMVLEANKGKNLEILYFGNHISDTDLESIWSTGIPGYEAYPVYGIWPDRETALEVTHADGNLSTQLKVESVSTTQEPTATVTAIRLKDTAYPFYVTVYYRAYNDVDMIETWTEIENQEKKPVRLTRFDSGTLPIRYGNVCSGFS